MNPLITSRPLVSGLLCGVLRTPDGGFGHLPSDAGQLKPAEPDGFGGQGPQEDRGSIRTSGQPNTTAGPYTNSSDGYGLQPAPGAAGVNDQYTAKRTEPLAGVWPMAPSASPQGVFDPKHGEHHIGPGANTPTSPSGPLSRGIEVTPPELKYGPITADDSAMQFVTIKNTEPAPAQLTLGVNNPAFGLVGKDPYDYLSLLPEIPTALAGDGEVRLPVKFLPKAAGAYKGSLAIGMSGMPYREDRVLSVAHVALSGTALPVDEGQGPLAAQTRDAHTDVASSALKQAREDAKAVQSGQSNDTKPLDTGLWTQYEEGKIALAHLNRMEGRVIDGVKTEAGHFKEKLGPESSTLLFDLLMFGLDRATVGLAGTLGNQIKTALKHRGITENAAVGAADMFKDVFKMAGKAGKNELFPKDSKPAHANPLSERMYSGDPANNLFFVISSVLSAAQADRERGLLDIFKNLSLIPDREKAIDIMKQLDQDIAKSVEKAIQELFVYVREAWMSFLSQSGLGSLNAEDAKKKGLATHPDGGSITDIQGASKSGKNLSNAEGVLRLKVVVVDGTPQIVGAEMKGVSEDMTRSLMDTPLNKLSVVIALDIEVGEAPIPGLNILPVYYDEAGNAEPLGTNYQQDSWLASYGGWDHSGEPTRAKQLAGAKKIQSELLSRPLRDLNTVFGNPIDVETNNGEKYRNFGGSTQ